MVSQSQYSHSLRALASPGKRIRSGVNWLALSGMLAACLPLTAISAGERSPGLGFITSFRGTVGMTHPDGQRGPVQLHQSLLPEGKQFRTDKYADLFLALSNGAALGIGSETQLTIQSYEQRPISSRAESREHEPTVSVLILQLDQGTLAVAAGELSPLSQVRIQTPLGEVQVQKGTCLIQLDFQGLHLGAIDGNSQLTFPNSNEREFLSPGHRIRISEQSLLLQQIASQDSVEEWPTSAREVAAAAQHASTRVFFIAPHEPGQAARPIRILPKTFFEQPSARPYSVGQ